MQYDFYFYIFLIARFLNNGCRHPAFRKQNIRVGRVCVCVAGGGGGDVYVRVLLLLFVFCFSTDI